MREFADEGKGRDTTPEFSGFFTRVKVFWEVLTDQQQGCLALATGLQDRRLDRPGCPQIAFDGLVC